MTFLAPGKLILSGEHAIVYGKPALAMAVNRYVTTTTTPQLLPIISFDLLDLKYQRGLTFQALKRLKDRVQENYQRFLRGDFRIRDVLHKPFELAQFALTCFLDTLNLKLNEGIKVHVQSTIPIGCGMGSSAATILSIVYAIAAHLKIEVTPEMLLRLSTLAENMQHGHSSGLDLQVAQQGGCVYVEGGKLQTRNLPEMPMYLVNTGVPATTTGECVSAVAHHFKTGSLGDDFAAITNALDIALQANNAEEILQAIAANHQLLTRIGVVPQKVQTFITEIQQQGNAAKICGAGAVAGDNAGIVLITGTQDISAICARYNYSILSINGEARGVHCI